MWVLKEDSFPPQNIFFLKEVLYNQSINNKQQNSSVPTLKAAVLFYRIEQNTNVGQNIYYFYIVDTFGFSEWRFVKVAREQYKENQ